MSTDDEISRDAELVGAQGRVASSKASYDQDVSFAETARLVTTLAKQTPERAWLGEEAIRAHFNARRRERRREQVEHWKETGVYPYKSEPANETERAERAVFDVVSGTLVPHISKTKKQAPAGQGGLFGVESE